MERLAHLQHPPQVVVASREVGPSKYPYRIAYPVVAPAGMPLQSSNTARASASHITGNPMMPDNLDNIEELIANYVLEELGGSDEV